MYSALLINHSSHFAGTLSICELFINKQHAFEFLTGFEKMYIQLTCWLFEKPWFSQNLKLLHLNRFLIFIRCPEERHECRRRFAGNSLFWQAHAFEVLAPTSTYRWFIICVFYLSKFHTKQGFVFNIIFYNSASGIFELWEFYHSHPFAWNKQNLHIASFPASCTCSHHSAGHTTIS